jgi:hypothetical protein
MKYSLSTVNRQDFFNNSLIDGLKIVFLIFSIFTFTDLNAEIVKDIKVSGLRITIKRTAYVECENKFNYYFMVEGVIGPDAKEILSRTIDSVEPCVLTKIKKRVRTSVYLNSAGGYMVDGFRLGEFFRENGIQTEIGNGDVCASACAFAFLGGVSRRMTGNAVLLFHSPYRQNGIGIDCSNKNDKKMFENYLIKFMGDADGKYLFERSMSYCTNENGWAINKDAAEIFNIVNYGKSYENLSPSEKIWFKSIEKKYSK